MINCCNVYFGKTPNGREFFRIYRFNHNGLVFAHSERAYVSGEVGNGVAVVIYVG